MNFCVVNLRLVRMIWILMKTARPFCRFPYVMPLPPVSLFTIWTKLMTCLWFPYMLLSVYKFLQPSRILESQRTTYSTIFMSGKHHSPLMTTTLKIRLIGRQSSKSSACVNPLLARHCEFSSLAWEKGSDPTCTWSCLHCRQVREKLLVMLNLFGRI